MLKICTTLCLIALPFMTGCTASTPAGHVGVMNTYGKINDTVLSLGIDVVWPWRRIYYMPIQTREIKETANSPTKKGLAVSIEVSFFYHLNENRAKDVRSGLGTEYEKNWVETQFKSAMRDTTTQYEAEDLYTANRSQIEDKLKEVSQALVAEKGFTVESARLRDVRLPDALQERINAKLAAEQDALRMQYILQQTDQQAEVRRKEARGFADAQTIIQKDLGHNYLVYLWIKVLEKAAEHGNSTIYIPTGSDGMPLFKAVK